MKLTKEQLDKVFLLLDTLQAYLPLSSSDGNPVRKPLRAKLAVMAAVVRRDLTDQETIDKAISTLENEGGITHA